MTTGQHTPGPWKALDENGRYDNRKNTWSVSDDAAGCSEAAPITLADGTVVAFAVWSEEHFFVTDKVTANARLIAAAPDLLAVASSALALIEGDLTGAEWKRACHKFTQSARAAIARASRADDEHQRRMEQPAPASGNGG